MARPRKSAGSAEQPDSVQTTRSTRLSLTAAVSRSRSTRSTRTSTRPATNKHNNTHDDVRQDSDNGDDDDDDELVLQTPRRRSTRPSAASNDTRKLVPVIYLPATNMSEIRKPASKQKAAAVNSDTNSASPSTRDNSTDYETPATSAANTPPAYLSAVAASKRKRGSRLATETTTSIDTDNDAKLAAAMQQQEYEEVEDRESISDPEEEAELGSEALAGADDFSDDDDLSDAYEVDDSDDDRPLKKVRATAKAKAARATPKRKAASAARPSLVVEDSDSAPLTELESEFDAAEDSDVADAEAAEEVADGGYEIGDVDANVPLERPSRRRARLSRAARERRKLETSHPEIKTMWKDLREIPMIPREQAPQPTSITRQLKSFQLEGLNWMVKQEQTRWKGGLLGDEMGMGKTIQAVSLIMSDYPQKQPTLVVVPPVALMQWSNEIKEYTDGKLKVLIYHGSNVTSKKLSVSELKAYNVIMISYSGLESIYRKETKGWSRRQEIVKEDSPIHAIEFHRLILDEAHSIKQRTTGVAKACFALKGKYKWCLSGTPVQNRIGEFFSLLRFLEVTPYANYFCKSCSCSALHWASSTNYRCSQCNHRALDHVSVFNQEILNPIVGSEAHTTRREAFAKLRLITDHIMLRRMKRDQTAAMELPPKEIIIHNEFFGPIESDFASSIMHNTSRQFDTYVSRGVMLNNYANIFGLIMQMRQVADHPDLILRKHAAQGQNVLVCNICDEAGEDVIRSRCRHDFCRACIKDFIRSYEEGDEPPGCPRCHIPLTIDLEQPEMEQDEDAVKKNSIINRIKMENWTSSTKIEMLVYDLWKLRSKKQTTKSIVFSQFTSMLQLVEWRLRRAGFSTVMLDGSMTPQQRQKSIEHFMTNPDVEVFLVSLKAGGVALNLTEASRVFIIDPWWNPAAEWQSADRCHRIGQRRPCVITRLVVEDSIESRIVMLQEKKAQMIQGTVNNDDVAIEKLTPQDMQFLFRGT